MNRIGETDSGTPAVTAADTIRSGGLAGLDRDALFQLLLKKRIEAARALDNAAAAFEAAFALWRCAGEMVSGAWPENRRFQPQDFAVLRDLRYGAWALPHLVQDLLVQGGGNAIGSLEARERAAWEPHFR